MPWQRSIRIFALVCGTAALSEDADLDVCGAGAGQGKCGYDDGTGTYESSATGRGQGTARLCGDWCQASEAEDTPCTVDTRRHPCRGEYWCATTCALWALSEQPHLSKVSCERFVRTSAYPRGGEVCKEECLLSEIRPDRYPAPTGLGFLCRPGTCDPAVQERYAAWPAELGLGVLECPCNWFGADCRDDWVPVQTIRRRSYGDLQEVRLVVGREGWRRIMADHRPGGVVRVQHLDGEGVAREQPFALANVEGDGTAGELEFLAGPPDDDLHPTVTEVARRVRSLPEGEVANLFVNPSVSGFFNRRYGFLMASLSGVEHVVLAATGAGFSGVRPLVTQLAARGVQVHLHFGLRDLRHLPYREEFEAWSLAPGVHVTLLVSGSGQAEPGEEGLTTAVGRGEALRRLAASAGAPPSWLRGIGKLYVQHSVGLSLAAGPLLEAGAALPNTAVVLCGRSELLVAGAAVLEQVCGGPECPELLGRRVFTNV